MKSMINEEAHIRTCLEDDLDAVMDLQQRVCRAITEPELFVTTSRDENATFLIPPNEILGAFFGDQLGAYCSLVFPGMGADNYGWELHWTAEQVIKCAKIDTVVVDPAFRGRGLQRKLVRHGIKKARFYNPEMILLTTVSPQNTFSLKNMQAEGFEILLETVMYGGCKRFVLGNFPKR